MSQTGIAGFDKGQHIYVGFSLLVLTLIAISTFYRQPLFRFWLVATVLFALLCLGPTLLINGQDTHLKGPFMLLQLLPFFKGNRYPSRFSVMLILGLAVLAALGLVQAGMWLQKRTHSPLVIYGLVCLCLLYTSPSPRDS